MTCWYSCTAKHVISCHMQHLHSSSVLACYSVWLLLSSINGVTNMVGYRQALNLSYHSLGGNETQESCDANDDVETSAILVIFTSFNVVIISYFIWLTMLYSGFDSVPAVCGMSNWNPDWWSSLRHFGQETNCDNRCHSRGRQWNPPPCRSKLVVCGRLNADLSM